MHPTGRLVAALLLMFSVTSALGQTIRVLLAEVDAGEVRLDTAHRGFVDGAPRFETAYGLHWPFGVDDGTLMVDGRPVGGSLAIEPEGEGFTFEGRRYRGSVTLTAHEDAVRVVNLLPLDDYLRGVVPSEMHAGWPLEALKAQAIAARTYTLSSLDPGRGWDICATEACQVYEGRDAEHARADHAIAETAALVLTHDGRFARTYYHADSGGIIASSAEVWGSRAPYLVAIQDVSTSTPFRRWRHTIDGDAVRATLTARGLDVGSVTRIRVTGTSESGRAARLEIQGTRGSTELTGTVLTDAIRGWGLRSTRFRMVGDMVAEGDGWGHGVGMSQYGARALAASGYAYWQILAFYYPGTMLQRLP